MRSLLLNIRFLAGRNLYLPFTLVLFCIFIWIRFSAISIWGDLHWDQVHTAWVSASILNDHQLPLRSMMIKGNSGIHIGPLYYYLVAVFYWISRYDPIASPIFAGVTGVFGFIVLFWCVRKIHGSMTAFISVFLLTFSGAAIIADRVQWSPNFIPPISLLLFYNVYRVIQGNPKNLLWIGVMIGLAFHIHFIVVLFIGMVLAASPFFPRNKHTLYFAVLAIGIVIASLIPNIIYELKHPDNAAIGNAASYASSYYHGFHIRRVMQLFRDAFIDVEKILPFWFIGRGIYLLPILYTISLWYFSTRAATVKLSVLVGIWLFVPWITFSTYSGEISDYYFSSFRYIAILMVAYIVSVMITRSVFTRVIATVFLVYYAVHSWNIYTVPPHGNMSGTKEAVKQSIKEGKVVPFVEGSLNSYVYFMYTELTPVQSR